MLRIQRTAFSDPFGYSRVMGNGKHSGAKRPDRGELVTRGEFYRALWIQGAGIVAILGALRFLPI